MSANFDYAYSQQYDTTLNLAGQQRESRLLSTVQMDKMAGVSKYYERLAALGAPNVRTSRFTPVRPQDVNFSRRLVTPTSFESVVLVDSFDKMRMALDPSSEIVTSQIAAFHRQIDDVIISGLTGVANTQGVVNGAITPVSPLSGNTVAVNYCEPGTSQTGNQGLTVGKLKEAKRIIFSTENAIPGEPIVAVVNQAAINQLLRDPQVTNIFYQEAKPLVRGDLDAEFLGFRFVRSERLPVPSANQATCMVYTESAAKFTWLEPLHGRIDPRPDLEGEVYQLKSMASLSSVRMWEERVVQLTVDLTQ